ncbi:MAG TPA: YceI family protein [Polyangiaceae bacterium]|nr:YceI family protein [Polyangiaceae bacterium]
MPKYDETQAECLVFTFKEGLLSKVAHDLKIRVTRFSADVTPDSVRAKFDLRSLRVVEAMKDGNENSGALSDADKAKIAEQISNEVLHAAQHPSAVFSSRAITPRADGGYSIAGELSLHGVTQPIQVETRSEGGRQVASVELHQPSYGITPFKAMMGTLKVKADVIVRFSVPGS